MDKKPKKKVVDIYDIYRPLLAGKTVRAKSKKADSND